MTAILARPAWVQDAVFYQVFPDRFANGDPTLDPPDVAAWDAAPNRDDFHGGDLAGITSRLDYLAELGITGLWLNPIFAAGTNHRYDTHDYRRIDPRLGDETALKRLVHDAHDRGIRVVLDGVFNHCGDGFFAFQDLLANGTDSPYRDWFTVTDLPVRTDPPNYQTCGGAPYLPKLNTDNPQVRQHLLDVAAYWIETADIDGWRLDVPWKVPHDFWVEFADAVRAIKPDAYLVGEVWRDPTPWLDVFDGAMNYRLREVLLDYCLHDDMDAEDAALEIAHQHATTGPATGWMLNLLGSHDTPRLATLANDPRRPLLTQTAMFTLPGVPMIYYGDELGMRGGNDPECRATMPAVIDQDGQAQFEQLQQLAALRRDHVALRCGNYEPLLAFNGVFAFRRDHDDDQIVVVLNPRRAMPEVTVPNVDPTVTRWRDLLTGDIYTADEGRVEIGRMDSATALLLAPDTGGQASAPSARNTR